MELYLVFLLSLVSLDKVISGNCPENCNSKTCDDEDSGCPECEEAYWGRHCQYPMECMSSPTGVEYRGTMNTTKTGIVCQAWNSQTPHKHSNTHFPSNYCRHKGTSTDFPWCYTMDSSIRTERCSIQQCNTHCNKPDFNVGYDVASPPRNGFTPGLVLDVIIPCETGYTAPSESSITCQNNSLKWTEWPKCERVKCQKPAIDNAVVPIQVEFMYNDTIHIECNTGYELEGNSAMMCQANKTWSSLPTCQAVECPVPTLNNHSFIVNAMEGQRFTYTDVINVSCETGYVVQGQSSLVCLANKTWSYTLPTCMIKKCQQPDLSGKNMHIQNPQGEYVYEDVITVACDSGAVMSSNDTHYVCQANGTWGREFQACKYDQHIEVSESKSELNIGVILGGTFAVLTVVGVLAVIFILVRKGRLNMDCIKPKADRKPCISLEELEKDPKRPKSVDNAYGNVDGDGNNSGSDLYATVNKDTMLSNRTISSD